MTHDINITKRHRGSERRVSGPEQSGRIPAVEQDGREGEGTPSGGHSSGRAPNQVWVKGTDPSVARKGVRSWVRKP